MPDPEIWPPKPNLPDPLTEYDALIKEQTIALPGEPPALRLFNLLQVLRKEKGLDWLSGLVVVQSYYRRHGPPPDAKRQTVFALTGLALAFPALVLQFYNIYLMFQRDAVLSQPNHYAALHFLNQERQTITLIVSVLLALSMGLFTAHYGVIRFQSAHKK